MPQKPLKIHSEFLKSAVKPEDYPSPEKPEIAIAGRSNAGKSSLLNVMLGRDLAKVSTTPGKTQTLNFFNCGTHYRMVDLPGYGFSKETQSKMFEWDEMIQSYLSGREVLKGVIIVMDIRRDWEDFEDMLVSWLGEQGLKYIIILTKADKLNKKQLEDRIKKIKQDSNIENVFPCSSLKNTGIVEIENYIFKNWIKGD